MRLNLNFDYVARAAESECVARAECFFLNFVTRNKRNIVR